LTQLQLHQRFSSSASVTPSDSTAQLLEDHDKDVTASDDTFRPTCRRDSVASSSSSRSVSFLRLRSHSLRCSQIVVLVVVVVAVVVTCNSSNRNNSIVAVAEVVVEEVVIVVECGQ